jgi:uncharacterized protein YdeI (YjbR/CyaY-like superfamily)
VITRSEDYFQKGCGRCARFDTPACSALLWSKGLHQLRKLCLQAGLVETAKWGHPCYLWRDKNVAIIGALQSDFRISFFSAAWMRDAANVLEKQGPNCQHKDSIRFESEAAVLGLSAVIADYLEEAKAYVGMKIPKVTTVRELPSELTIALQQDLSLATAFAKLTAGRQNSYAIAIGSAKTAATQRARIEKFRNKIFAGKGALER